jgi:hypothetical protein
MVHAGRDRGLTPPHLGSRNLVLAPLAHTVRMGARRSGRNGTEMTVRLTSLLFSLTSFFTLATAASEGEGPASRDPSAAPAPPPSSRDDEPELAWSMG